MKQILATNKSSGGRSMVLDSDTIRALTDRGIDLMPPAGATDWARVEAAYSLGVGSDFKTVYSLFNGFLVHDEGSWLMMWGVDRIIENRGVYRGPVEARMVPIGDYLIESDIIVACISEECAGVRLLYEERDLAPSLQSFVAMIAAGAFDWPKHGSAAP